MVQVSSSRGIIPFQEHLTISAIPFVEVRIMGRKEPISDKPVHNPAKNERCSIDQSTKKALAEYCKSKENVHSMSHPRFCTTQFLAEHMETKASFTVSVIAKYKPIFENNQIQNK